MLTLDELQVIQGALDMASKTAESAMTPLDKVGGAGWGGGWGVNAPALPAESAITPLDKVGRLPALHLLCACCAPAVRACWVLLVLAGRPAGCTLTHLFQHPPYPPFPA